MDKIKDFYRLISRHTGKELKVPIFCYHIRRDSGWFRLFGKGLAWKDTNKHKLSFSERNGYQKYYMFGKWSIGVIK